jgi:hypothetical protein
MPIIINSKGHELDVNERTLKHVGKKELKGYKLKSKAKKKAS